jgi:protein-disulfide isomerase
MPSGKRAKEQRRQAAVAPPPVRSKGGPGLGARQASPRALAIAGAVILVVIVAVVLAVVLGRSSGAAMGDGTLDGQTILLASGTPAVGDPSGPNAVAEAADVATMFKGIPQDHFVLGKADAPVTLVEYIDFQCPVCQQFEVTELPTLLTKYVRPGKLKILMEPWNILDRVHGTVDSLRGQKGVIAAAAQNKAFEFSEVLYDNQGVEGTNWMDDRTISNFAASVDGLKTSQFVTDANSADTMNKIQLVDSYANAQPDFIGTPTLLLGKGTAKPKYYTSGGAAMGLSALEPAIDALLK